MATDGGKRSGPAQRRMFGDYPVDGAAYWIWLAGIAGIGLASVVLMIAIK